MDDLHCTDGVSWDGEVTTGRIPDHAFMLIAAGGVLPVPHVAGRLRSPDHRRALRLQDHQKPQQRPDLAIKNAAAPESGAGDAAETRKTRPPIDKNAARTALRRLLAEAVSGRFICVPSQWCAATAPQGWRIVTVDDARFVGVACEEADIVVTPVMLRFRTCRSGALLLSGQSLRRTGAVEIYGIGSGKVDKAAGHAEMRVVFAQEQLQRSWARHRTYDWRTGLFDAPAAGE